MEIAEFDVGALYEALDAARRERQLTWREVAEAIWNLSAELNDRRSDHPISPATLTGMRTRGFTSCQHALFMLRFLGRSPESFLVGGPGPTEAPLPPAGPDRRLRWNLDSLAAALDERRQAERLTWTELAGLLRCTPHQLTGIRRARFAIGMGLAMRIVLWLERPAADFVYAARW